MAAAAPSTPRVDESKHTISFAILDVFRMCPGFPIHVPYVKGNNPEANRTSIRLGVEELLADLKAQLYGEKTESKQRDNSHYFDTYFFENKPNPRILGINPGVNDIVEGLAESGQFVLNRVNKYYAIAFAIDYKRFPIYSKDCETITIKWRETHEDVACVNPDPKNVNPVIALLTEINGN